MIAWGSSSYGDSGARLLPSARRRLYPGQRPDGAADRFDEVALLARLGQEEAFRFARGEEVTATTGTRARLGRPLDWVVVTDHAEMYGLMPQLLGGDPEILATEKGKRWYDMLRTGDEKVAFAAAMEIVDRS